MIKRMPSGHWLVWHRIHWRRLFLSRLVSLQMTWSSSAWLVVLLFCIILQTRETGVRVTCVVLDAVVS
jgi:hypothetical protein